MTCLFMTRIPNASLPATLGAVVSNCARGTEVGTGQWALWGQGLCPHLGPPCLVLRLLIRDTQLTFDERREGGLTREAQGLPSSCF